MIFKLRNLKEGDKINIEGELYLITKTKIGNCNKKRINLLMVKNIKDKYLYCEKCGIINEIVRFEGETESYICDGCLYELKGGLKE